MAMTAYISLMIIKWALMILTALGIGFNVFNRVIIACIGLMLIVAIITAQTMLLEAIEREALNNDNRAS